MSTDVIIAERLFRSWHLSEMTKYCTLVVFHWHSSTHTRLTALFLGLPRWATTRKVKPIWILLKQVTVSVSGISWAICKSAPCSRQTTTPALHHHFFTGRMPFLPPNQQRQSTEGTHYNTIHITLQSHITHYIAHIIYSTKVKTRIKGLSCPGARTGPWSIITHKEESPQKKIIKPRKESFWQLHITSIALKKPKCSKRQYCRLQSEYLDHRHWYQHFPHHRIDCQVESESRCQCDVAVPATVNAQMHHITTAVSMISNTPVHDPAITHITMLGLKSNSYISAVSRPTDYNI